MPDSLPCIHSRSSIQEVSFKNEKLVGNPRLTIHLEKLRSLENIKILFIFTCINVPRDLHSAVREPHLDHMGSSTDVYHTPQ